LAPKFKFDLPIAEITPKVTVLSRPTSPKGFPIAIAHSPISSLEESPKGAIVTFSPSLTLILMTATSVLGSKPTTSAV